MKRFTFDTDIFIDNLRGFKKAILYFTNFFDNKENVGYCSTLTVAELLSGKECENLEKRKSVLDLLSLFTIIGVDFEIAKKAGEFRRKYNTMLIDSIIAATTFTSKATLITRNIQDFKSIKEVEVKVPY